MPNPCFGKIFSTLFQLASYGFAKLHIDASSPARLYWIIKENIENNLILVKSRASASLRRPNEFCFCVIVSFQFYHTIILIIMF